MVIVLSGVWSKPVLSFSKFFASSNDGVHKARHQASDPRVVVVKILEDVREWVV